LLGSGVASQWVRNSAVEAARDEGGNAASKQAIVERLDYFTNHQGLRRRLRHIGIA